VNHPKSFILPTYHPKFQKLLCTIKKLFFALFTIPSTYTSNGVNCPVGPCCK
jgi:hypothetical protein